MYDKRQSILSIYENLFNPIDKKDYGLYWNVSNNKTKPLANAEELLKYVERESKEGSFINRYANLNNDLILENNIYLDFDLTNNDYLKAEESLTLTVLEALVEEEIDVDKAENYSVKNTNVLLKQIQDKYNNNYTVENGFSKGYSSFIDGLTIAEEGALTKLVRSKEKEEIKDKSEKEIQKYYLDKFEQDYLKEPFKDVITVANYFESIGVKTIVNLSGSKGFHLRIPITVIDFEGTELKENPENVKLFLEKLAELIETKILKKSYKKSSLDYYVFKKGMQRIPCSKHNKTKLYANFIEPSVNYLEAIDILEEKVSSYVPEVVDVEENTKTFIESDIYKATIKKATEEATSTFKSEKANSNYNFKGEHKELLENISKVYLPSCRNEVGFRIVHLLRRSNFEKSDVEEIFKQLHEDQSDYNETIKGSINHAYNTEKLVGLKSLIKWLKDNASEEVKEDVINYFTKNFNYYEAPVETTLEDVLLIHEKEYNLTEIATSTKKYYVLKNFEAEENTLEINKEKAVVLFRKNKRVIAKLPLKTSDKKAVEGLVPSSKDKLDKFKKNIEKKTEINKDVIEETINELDSYLTYIEEEEQEQEEQKQQEEEISEEISETNENDVIIFGNEGNTFYMQTEEGIFFRSETEKGIRTTKVANVVINDLTIIIDSLGILEPVYNVTFYDLTFDEEIIIKHSTAKQLVEDFSKARVFKNPKPENISYVLNNFIIDGTSEGFVEVKKEAYLEGYFILDGKVVENTNIKDMKEPTKEELAEAIELLNTIMKDRTKEGKANDSSVYRFMLWSPFSYCFKQLGYGKANYSLILTGKSRANKTGASKIGNLFYNHVEEETTGATTSVLGSKLSENSYCTIFDESADLFFKQDALNVIKRAVYEKTGRAVKDRNDNTKIDNFPAINLPIFLLNEPIIFKDYIINRYKIVHYSLDSVISDDDKKEFLEKYNPEPEDSVLRKLAVIGKVFSEKLKAIIENPSERNRLFNIEELTIELLKEIQEKAEVEFLPELLEITESSTKYNYDVATEIKSLLNTEFKKRINKHDNYYIASDFVQSAKNSNFNFLKYDSKKQKFLIMYSKFNKFINEHIEEYVELEEILEKLDLKEKLEQEAKGTKFSNYSDYIRKANRIGSKNYKGFYLDVEDLAYKVFGIQLTEETD